MRIALLVALLAIPAVAKEREGIVAQPTIQVASKTLHLMGLGLRKKFVFKVYLASLYVENPIEDAPQLLKSDQIKRVQMNMLRDLERGKIVEAVQEGFEKNSAPEMPRLQERLNAFLKSIPDLKSGQTIVITYYPSRGTLIKAGNGEEITLAGKDFADALFSVWLGNHPVDDDLKGEMLSNNK